MWQAELGALDSVFRLPDRHPEVVIYTTNAVESLNMSLRKVIKTRGSFPNAEAAMKLLYLALEHIAEKWTMLYAEIEKRLCNASGHLVRRPRPPGRSSVAAT